LVALQLTTGRSRARSLPKPTAVPSRVVACGLFLLYGALVALSTFTTIVLVGELAEPVLKEQRELAFSASGGGLLIVLAIATMVQDISGVVVTALARETTPDVAVRPI